MLPKHRDKNVFWWSALAKINLSRAARRFWQSGQARMNYTLPDAMQLLVVFADHSLLPGVVEAKM